MKNGIFSLGSNDFVKGLVVMVFSAIIVTLYGVVITNGFDLFTVNWSIILHNIANVGFVTFISYIAKNFLTNNKGQVAGVIGTN